DAGGPGPDVGLISQPERARHVARNVVPGWIESWIEAGVEREEIGDVHRAGNIDAGGAVGVDRDARTVTQDAPPVEQYGLEDAVAIGRMKRCVARFHRDFVVRIARGRTDGRWELLMSERLLVIRLGLAPEVRRRGGNVVVWVVFVRPQLQPLGRHRYVLIPRARAGGSQRVLQLVVDIG